MLDVHLSSFFLGVKTTFETHLRLLFFVWLCFPSLMIPKWRIPIISMDIGLYSYNQRGIHVRNMPPSTLPLAPPPSQKSCHSIRIRTWQQG